MKKTGKSVSSGTERSVSSLEEKSGRTRREGHAVDRGGDVVCERLCSQDVLREWFVEDVRVGDDH
jgi:hypothetical protein